jgi:Kinesin motor domain
MNNPDRKTDVWSSKLQSYVVIYEKKEDQDISHLENAFSIGRADGKKQTFVFDSVVEDNLRDTLLLKMKKSIRLIRLGFNSSIYINCNSKLSDSAAEIVFIRDQIQTLYKGFEADEKNVENGIQSGGEILLFRSVKLSSHELFDNHIIDLSLQHVDDAAKVKSTTTSARKPDQFIRLLHGAVTNLGKATCPTLESAMAVVDHAMSMRLFMSVSPTESLYDMKPTDPGKAVGASSRLLGAIGVVFITVEVEQLVYIVASGNSTRRQSTLEFVLFPSADTLTFKPEKSECIQSIRFSEFNPTISPVNTDEFKMKTIRLLASLLCGVQALSALTRVVKALRGNLPVGDAESASTALQAVPKQHVPYRDSLFTRLLKPSLHGNCNVTMVTIANGGSESLSKCLRFASEINCLYNTIWANNSQGDTSSCTLRPEELQTIMTNFVSKAEEKREVRMIPNDSADKYRSPISTTSHLAAFNDVLLDFQRSLASLVDFSSAFLGENPEKVTSDCMTGMGITPMASTPMPAMIEEEDDLRDAEHYSGSYMSRFHTPPQSTKEELARLTLLLQTGGVESAKCADLTMKRRKTLDSEIPVQTEENRNGGAKVRPTSTSFCITDCAKLNSKGECIEGLMLLQKELESFGIQFVYHGGRESLKSSSLDNDGTRKKDLNAKKGIPTVKSLENMQDLKGGDSLPLIAMSPSKRVQPDYGGGGGGGVKDRDKDRDRDRESPKRTDRSSSKPRGSDPSPVPSLRKAAEGTDRASYRSSAGAGTGAGDTSRPHTGRSLRSHGSVGGRSTAESTESTRSSSRGEHRGSYHKANSSVNVNANVNVTSSVTVNVNSSVNVNASRSSEIEAVRDILISEETAETAEMTSRDLAATMSTTDERDIASLATDSTADSTPCGTPSKPVRDTPKPFAVDSALVSPSAVSEETDNCSQLSVESIQKALNNKSSSTSKSPSKSPVTTLPSITPSKLSPEKMSRSAAYSAEYDGSGKKGDLALGASGILSAAGSRRSSRVRKESVTSKSRRGSSNKTRSGESQKLAGSAKSDIIAKKNDTMNDTEILPSLVRKNRKSSQPLIEGVEDDLNETERSYLHAVSQGNTGQVEILLRGKIDCNVKNGFGR